MAVGHYAYNKATPAGALLHSALRDIEEGRENLRRVVASFIQMKDGSSVTAYAAAQFGFADATVAEAALAELESMKGQLDGAAVLASLDQGFAKFRNG